MAKVMVEKKSGRRVMMTGEENEKTKWNYVGEDKAKSLKTVMFTKLFRDLNEDESPDQLTEEQLVAYKEAKTAKKAVDKKAAAEKRETSKAAKEAAAAERRALLVDENIKLVTTSKLSHRNNACVCVSINEEYSYESEITGAGKVSYAWLKDSEGKNVEEFNNKGIGTVAPWLAEKLNLKPEALSFMLKDARKEGISSCTITADDVKKAKEAAKEAKVKEAEEAKAAKEEAKAAKEAKVDADKEKSE